MGFLDSLGTVLGGFNDVKQIDKDGFDFREQRAAQQFARDREVEMARQADETRDLGMAEDILVGGGEEGDIQPFLSNLDPARRVPALKLLQGRAGERKSALEATKAYNNILLQRSKNEAAQERVETQGANAQALARVKADIEAGREPSPRDLALIEARGNVQRELFDRAEAGRDRRFGSALGGRKQLRLVSDGQGGTEYRWISPGETAVGPPTATQRETAGMAGNIADVIDRMEELAPDVTHGPIAGRISEAWQSQYPSGKEADFDLMIKELVNLAYLKSGKQINKQELEMQLRGYVSRSKGDLPGQVKRAKPFIENYLKPYERTGAISERPDGASQTRTYGGVTYRLKPGADPKKRSSWEAVR